MRKRRLGSYLQPAKVVLSLALLLVVAVVGVNTQAAAETSSSTNYQLSNSAFGNDAATQNCSTQYCAQASVGASAAGDTVGSTSTAKFGNVTQSQPELQVIVSAANASLGVLSTSTPATGTMTIQISNYLSTGYTLEIVGDPPSYGGHTLSALTTPTASAPGTEQFGINAAANTTPSVGADPVQVPSGAISFGVANDDYKTPNLFKYVSGDAVAHSSSASGQTNYTISLLVNISSGTPAGHYSGDFAAVVIPVY